MKLTEPKRMILMVFTIAFAAILLTVAAVRQFDVAHWIPAIPIGILAVFVGWLSADWSEAWRMLKKAYYDLHGWRPHRTWWALLKLFCISGLQVGVGISLWVTAALWTALLAVNLLHGTTTPAHAIGYCVFTSIATWLFIFPFIGSIIAVGAIMQYPRTSKRLRLRFYVEDHLMVAIFGPRAIAHTLLRIAEDIPRFFVWVARLFYTFLVYAHSEKRRLYAGGVLVGIISGFVIGIYTDLAFVMAVGGGLIGAGAAGASYALRTYWMPAWALRKSGT